MLRNAYIRGRKSGNRAGGRLQHPKEDSLVLGPTYITSNIYFKQQLWHNKVCSFRGYEYFRLIKEGYNELAEGGV